MTEFRANGGKVAQFGDAPLVILHTIGARTLVTAGAMDVVSAGDADLRVAAGLERYSRHPVALAIVRLVRGCLVPELIELDV